MSRVRLATFLAAMAFAAPAAAETETEVTTHRVFHLHHLALRTTTTDAVFGMMPGIYADHGGITTGGVSSIENRWELDGLDITAPLLGGPAVAIPFDFANELSTVTSGHPADSPGAPGALFAMQTRRGGNVLAGSAFVFVDGGALAATPDATAVRHTSVEARRDTPLAVDLGFELGGPIVRDKAWFWVGVAPRLERTTIARVTQRRTDTDQDGLYDTDATTGLFTYEEIDRSEHAESNDRLTALARIDVAPAPGHQGTATLAVAPGRGAGAYLNGWAEQQAWETTALTHALGLRWSSRFGDRTELRAHVGDVRTARTFGSPGGTRDDLRLQSLYGSGLGTWAQLGGESPDTRQGCADSPIGDPYPLIANCPDTGEEYRIGGLGPLQDDHERRQTARASILHRVRALGLHALELGGELEQLTFERVAGLSGGARIQSFFATEANVVRAVRLRPGDADPAAYPLRCFDLRSPADAYDCQALDGDDGDAGATTRRALYVRDVWQPRRGVVLDVGLRHETQRVAYNDAVRGHLDPVTGARIGEQALDFDGLWSPRLGAVIDPTGEGRGRIYGGWGRVYEAIPLDTNARLFGGEATLYRVYGVDQCGVLVPGIPDGDACADDPGLPADRGTYLVNARRVVDAEVRAPHVDQWHVGVEHAIVGATVVGAAYRHVRVRHALEDVWNGEAFELTNPGPDTDDRASRDHDAIELVVRHDLSARAFVLASYTWSRTRGTYVGLIDEDRGRETPHSTSQFDVPALMANRHGAMPTDRAHYLKLDGYRAIPLTRDDTITLGGRVRVLSGTPIDVVGRHPDYGDGEVFLLPRGAGGRTPVTTSLDVHLEYGRALGGGMTASVFVDLFDVANSQRAWQVDERYTWMSTTGPIVGGRYEDLIWAKADGESTPIIRNSTYGQPTARFAPFHARLGARLTF